MSSPVRHTSSSGNSVTAFPDVSDLKYKLESPIARGMGLTAFSFEFVAKSDQEARLITVIIFWDSSEAGRNIDRGVRRVRALLAPYLDRCLRAQNLLAHFPAPQDRYSQASSIDTNLITDESIAQEANACAA